VYAKVAHGLWVDWRTILGSQRGNVIPYQTKVVQAHPSIFPSHPQSLLQMGTNNTSCSPNQQWLWNNASCEIKFPRLSTNLYNSHGSKIPLVKTWASLMRSWIETKHPKFGCCGSNGIIWSIWNENTTRGAHKRGKHIEANSIF